MLSIIMGLLKSKSKKPIQDNNPFLKSDHSIILIVLHFLLLLFIGQTFTFTFWRGLFFPISKWDAIATVAFKAKLIFYEGTLPDLAQLPHRAYPLFIPLAESWIAISLGVWDEQSVKIIFPLALYSLIFIQYHFLKCLTN